MAEKLKRIAFPKGDQKRFINLAIQKCGHLDSLADLLEVSSRTIRDWRREKFLMSADSAGILKKKCGLKLPKNIKLKDEFWYVTKGAVKGGLASYKKQRGQIGNPKMRLKKWHEWWEKEGRCKDFRIFHPLPFHIPKKSNDLAEFIGIMMGDGGMSDNQLIITLHHVDDLAYSKYVVKLTKRLFGVAPSVYHDLKNSVNKIVVSRSRLVRYLHELGLPIGNKVKQNFDIPIWIKKNRSMMTACVRGLVDTDGSVFTHSYKVNGTWYSYKKLCFCTYSQNLIRTVYTFLKNRGFHPRIAQEVDIRLDSISDMKRYFELIGSHNPKHWRRYKSMLYSNTRGGVA